MEINTKAISEKIYTEGKDIANLDEFQNLKE
jgi:hypothetical protein